MFARSISSGNFVDAYHNLTYKHVMGLKWVWENCAQAPRVMKMDDDIFVHVFNFHKLVRDTAANTNSLICYVQQQMPVTRDQGSKWRVQTHEYPLFYYEDYCSGNRPGPCRSLCYAITMPLQLSELYRYLKTLALFGAAVVSWINAERKRVNASKIYSLQKDGLI